MERKGNERKGEGWVRLRWDWSREERGKRCGEGRDLCKSGKCYAAARGAEEAILMQVGGEEEVAR